MKTNYFGINYIITGRYTLETGILSQISRISLYHNPQNVEEEY